jgi:hypothetical protein
LGKNMGAWFAAVSSDAANTPGIMVNTIRRQRMPASSFFFMVLFPFNIKFMLVNGNFRRGAGIFRFRSRIFPNTTYLTFAFWEMFPKRVIFLAGKCFCSGGFMIFCGSEGQLPQ